MCKYRTERGIIMAWRAMRILLVALALSHGPLGVAAAQVRVYREKKRCRGMPLYDPGQQHNNDCAFAAFLAATGVRQPSTAQIRVIRGLLCLLWQCHPESLAKVARHESMTEHRYLRQMARTMWGGVADISLLATAARIPISIEDGHGKLIWANTRRTPARLRIHQGHYTVVGWGSRKPCSQPFRRMIKLIEKQLRRTHVHMQNDEYIQEASRGGGKGDGREHGTNMRSRSPTRKQDKSHVEERRALAFPELCLATRKGPWCILCGQAWSTDHDEVELHKERFQDWEATAKDKQILIALKLRRYARYEQGMPQPHMELETLQQMQESRGGHASMMMKHGADRGGAPKARGAQQRVCKRPASEMEEETQAAVEENPAQGSERDGEEQLEPQTDAEEALSLSDADDDEALQAGLESALGIEEEQGGEEGLWSVICTYSTREYHARMRDTTSLRDLATTVALALTWPSTEVSLTMDGCILPLACPLRCVDPPYCFDVMRKAPIPCPVKPVRARAQKVVVDLGVIHPSEQMDSAFLLDEERQEGQASSSGDRCPVRPCDEMVMMTNEDKDVKTIDIRRPRERVTHSFTGTLRAEDYIANVAATKHVKRTGFVLYAAVEAAHEMQDGQEYYLVWERQGRGWDE